jgi:NDP-sugar pyrophosphorylase family protein
MFPKKTNILIPMAGRGKRFLDEGYKLPKPMLEIDGKPMIEYVIDNLAFPNANFIFIVLKEHVDLYGLDKVLLKKCPSAKIITIDGVTEGAAVTALKAAQYIDNDEALIIKDCDQILDWVPSNFFSFMHRNKADGGIMTIYTDDRGFSFVEPVKKGDGFFHVNRTAEKVVISTQGATGLYYFAKGSHFVKYAKKMIEKNIRTNNEFYLCPVYNELIDDDKSVLFYAVSQMLSLGVPRDFEKNKGLVREIVGQK